MAVQNQLSPEDIEKAKAHEARIKKDEEKRQKAKDKKEAEEKEIAKKARLKDGVIFVRKDTRPGIYSTNGIGKRLKIRDRGHYFTKINSEIEFLDNDPEIIEFAPGTPNKKK